MKKVSILVAAFNAEKFINETIESVLSQSYTNWELIIVDDGSTDKTANSVTEFSILDERIRLIQQKNAGAQIARNNAFSASTGEYVVILDADDCLLPEKISKQVSLLDANPEYGLVYGDTWHCDEKLNHICLESKKYPGQHVIGDVFDKIILGNIFAVHSAMVRRICLLEVGLHDINPELIGDWDLWVRVADKYSFLYHPDPVAEYRLHPSMSAQRYSAEKQFRQRMGVAKKIILMPRFKLANKKIHAEFHFTNGRYAHKFGFYEDAIIFYKNAFLKFPLNFKPLVGVFLAIFFRGKHS